MKNNFQRAVCWIAAGLSLLGLSAGAAEKPFKVAELKRFLGDSVPFLDWVRTNHQDRVVERLMEKPQFIAEFPEAAQYLRGRQWEPERFAYILNHVLVAYKRLGMGKETGLLLARLEQTKKAVDTDATQSQSEKERALAIVAQAQREARKIDRAFAQLPAEEVRLLWLHRARLRQAVEKRLPFREQVLPNQAGKPSS